MMPAHGARFPALSALGISSGAVAASPRDWIGRGSEALSASLLALGAETKSLKKDFGAAGDGTDATAAWLAAATWLEAGQWRAVEVPEGAYTITDTMSLTTPRSFVYGSGPGYGVKIINHCVAKKNLIEFHAAFDIGLVANMEIIGNGLTGAAGNGHCIAILGANDGSSSWVNEIQLERLRISGHRGTAKDGSVAAADTDAFCVYSYGTLDLLLRNVVAATSTGGLMLTGYSPVANPSEKVSAEFCIFDTCYKWGINADICEDIFLGNESICSQCGSGNAGEAGLFVNFARKLAAQNVRFKLCHPAGVKMSRASAPWSSLITFRDIYIFLGLVAGDKGFDLDTSARKLVIDGFHIDPISDAGSTGLVGIDIAGTTAVEGWSVRNGVVVPNGIAQLDAGVRVVSPSARLRSFEVANIGVGFPEAPSGAGSITTAFDFGGNLNGFGLTNLTGVITAPGTGTNGYVSRVSNAQTPANFRKAGLFFFGYTNGQTEGGTNATLLGTAVT